MSKICEFFRSLAGY